ncbi:putative histidine--tRNA ligase [Helianthus annuus]|nr:histidine--tRNA ligase, cytoplasmic [Helianthus annuus]XP_021973124.1 histidine--tRNA ligase, cytoplasmic [Helianthus annuus]KAF5799165.1 putative histidine--tRNA ligase [Helianthus annuus]KAJ0550646.1 putative histidine--tRNA ligase [Helianthus annuus]KAJ0557441.1 putative histidine--tRNA ligase [Helianthus annuus]KAJ0563605.1 putative histidine--tRNA ligase [Helianthus annuus]KAJ0728940.1 putative histidine--tRNA ligase [Helianthus annuus]
MAGERRVLTLGGKGFSLSSASVFEFSTASPPPLLKIDPSALARLSSSSSGRKPDQQSSPVMLQLSVPDFLTAEEARASILLLLYKLLLGGSSSSTAASQLLDILNNGSQTLTIDLDVDRKEDADLLKQCWPDTTLHAICALLDYTATSLATVSDAVAALSCEALKADTSTFNLFTDSGDGFSDKDRASVANDFKVLLNGSKMKSDLQSEQVFDIPRIHGRLRSVSKSVHSSTQIELNSTPLVQGTASKNLASLFSSLALSLQDLGESSWLRAKNILEGLAKENKYPNLVEDFSTGCPNIDRLNSSVTSFVTLKLEKSYVKSLHEVYSLSEAVRKILSWEATVSFISLDGIELIQVQNGTTDGVSAATPEKKKDKKKKVMGKGTTVLMQSFATNIVIDSSSLTQKVSQGFLSLFDMKSLGFEPLVQKVKEVVESNESRRLPKIPKGTRDFAKEQMAIREKAFSIIANVFKRHGAMALDTPVFELRETLTGKYGEDSKLIYDLADQGGELCSLRYDLTVPFARYVAMNGITSFRRYQIAKVYRRDNPSKGRYREFYQCDFDIAGDETTGADFEVVKILTELLDELNIGAYEIKLNHRKLLDGMLDICGVPAGKFRTVCSSIDKLDKQSFEQIRNELIVEKGLDAETVEKIGSYVTQRDHPLKLLAKLKEDGSEFLKNDSSKQALNELEKLFQALDNARCVDKVVFDLSLARGLDYYTGVIYEAVFKGTTQVGSIAAGGRYDKLIGMFTKKDVAAIGVSLGIERVFAIMEGNQKEGNQVVRASETQVLVSILGDDLSLAAKLVSMCWDAKLKAEFLVNKRLNKHFDRAKEFGIPWMVIVGEQEIKKGTVRLKNKDANVEKECATSNFVDELIGLMNNQVAQ